MQWILMLGLAMNDPNQVVLARVETQEECRKAEMIFWLTSTAAAKERGQDASPDLYLNCKATDEAMLKRD